MTESVRVSMVGGRTQVDVAVPADLPLSALLPDVLALLHIVDDPGRCWTLARVGGPPFAVTATLQDVDVHDGDLLVVTDDPPDTPGAMVDDVAAGVASLARDARSDWTADSARWAAYAAAVLAAVVAAVSATVAVAAGERTAPLMFTGVAAVMSMAAALAARRFGADRHLCATLSIVSCTFGSAAGVAAGGHGLPAQIALAGIVGGTLAIVGHRGTDAAATVHVAVATVGLGAAATGGLAAVWQTSASSIAATSAAIGVLMLPCTGRIAIAAAGLPLPPVPVAAPPTTDPTSRRSVVDGVDALGPVPGDPLGALADLALADLSVLSRRTAAASSYLTGLLAGIGVWIVAAVTATVALSGLPDTVVLVYCSAVAAALLIRGRVHTDRIQSTVLILSGACAAAGIVSATVWNATGSHPSASATAVAAMYAATALGAAGLLIGSVAAGRDFSPLQVRAVEIVQVASLVVVVPLLLWVLDAYRLVREW